MSQKLQQLKVPTLEEFFQKTQKLTRPVLISGLTSIWKTNQWGIDYLIQKSGHHTIQVYISNQKGEWISNPCYHEIKFGDFLKTLKDFSKKNENEEIYYAHYNLWKTLKELHEDIVLPSFLKRIKEKKKGFYTGIWIGSQIKTQLHFDLTCNLNLQIWGQKEYLLYPPTNIKNYYPYKHYPLHTVSQISEPKKVDFQKYPNFNKQKPYCIQLNPGDAVFMPAYWWHSMTSEKGPNLTLSFHWRRWPWENVFFPYYRHYVREIARHRLLKGIKKITGTTMVPKS